MAFEDFVEVARVAAWPDWWKWPIESTPHLLDRMMDRGFSETDLRTMLTDAVSFAADPSPGRWRVDTVWSGHAWRVIVEPDPDRMVVVVVTAYRIG